MSHLKAIAVLLLFPLMVSVHSYVCKTEIVNAATLQTLFSDEFEANSLDNHWTWINPNADCFYSLTDNYGYLRINVPDSDHDLDVSGGNQNAPRILQEISGDFVVETKLVFTFTASFQSAGILLWSNSSYFTVLERGYTDAYPKHFVRARAASTTEAYGGWAELGKTLFEDNILKLKVERRVNLFIFSYAKNDSIWTELASESMPLSKLLSVGLFVVVQGNDNPFYADFDFFRIFKMPPPSPPKNLQATGGNRLITLSWIPPSDMEGVPITNYRIYRGNSANKQAYLATIGNVTTYSDTKVVKEQEYYYKVSAISSSGESDLSNEASAVPIFLPFEEVGGLATIFLAFISIFAVAAFIPVVTHRKSFTRRNLSMWFREKKRDIAIVLGWTIAVTLILVKIYLLFYIRNPILKTMEPLASYAGPSFESLDLLILFVVSLLAGMMLIDMERIFYGYLASMISSFFIAVAVGSLYIWYVIGWERFSQIAFVWEYVVFWAMSNMLRAIFPLPIILGFLASFFGSIVRDWIKP